MVSLIVHDATLPLGWASLGDRCPGCVAGGRCPRFVGGIPHAYFATSISGFEFVFSLADDVISTSFRVHFRLRYLSSYLYPGILSMGISDTRVSIDGRT